MVRKRWYTIPHEIMGFFAHAQTVDTRLLFPPPMWHGYDATYMHTATQTAVTKLISYFWSSYLTYIIDVISIQHATTVFTQPGTQWLHHPYFATLDTQLSAFCSLPRPHPPQCISF